MSAERSGSRDGGGGGGGARPGWHVAGQQRGRRSFYKVLCFARAQYTVSGQWVV